jgi:hypothetical protein
VFRKSATVPQQFKSGDDVRLERLIAALPKGASFTEGEAMDCLYKRGLRRTNTIINGTTPEIHQLVSHGILRWASRAPRLLERTPPAAPPRRCRSVYVPPPVVEPWAEEIATLREQLQPSTPVSVGSGPYVKNGTGWPLWSHLLGRELASGEVVEVDEETVGAITRTGVFVRCQPAEVARLLTRSRSLAKVAAR